MVQPGIAPLRLTLRSSLVRLLPMATTSPSRTNAHLQCTLQTGSRSGRETPKKGAIKQRLKIQSARIVPCTCELMQARTRWGSPVGRVQVVPAEMGATRLTGECSNCAEALPQKHNQQPRLLQRNPHVPPMPLVVHLIRSRTHDSRD